MEHVIVNSLMGILMRLNVDYGVSWWYQHTI